MRMRSAYITVTAVLWFVVRDPWVGIPIIYSLWLTSLYNLSVHLLFYSLSCLFTDPSSTTLSAPLTESSLSEWREARLYLPTQRRVET
jgi:hypothetical protein